MNIPPGITYLIQRLPRIITPPIILYTATFLAQNYLGAGISGLALALSYILCLPLAFAVNVLYRDYSHHRDAARLGAVLPPRVGDPYPGGLMTLWTAMHNFKAGYIGMCLRY